MSSHRSIQFFVSAVCLSLSQWALAASIQFSPTSTTGLSIGDRFTLEIVGSGFVGPSGLNAGTPGGGIDVRWDSDVLAIASLSDIELLFPGDKKLSTDGTNNDGLGALDAAAGLLRDLSVLSLDSITSTSFSIAKITFTALGAGTTSVTMDTGTYAVGGRDSWALIDGETPVLSYGSATAAVIAPAPVPVPAALLLLSSALPLIAFRTSRLGNGLPRR
jgi:hypothetical protein